MLSPSVVGTLAQECVDRAVTCLSRCALTTLNVRMGDAAYFEISQKRTSGNRSVAIAGHIASGS